MEKSKILLVLSACFLGIGGVLLAFWWAEGKLKAALCQPASKAAQVRALTRMVWREQLENFSPEKQWTKEEEQQSFTLPILMFHYIQDIPATTKDQLGYRLSYAPQKLDQLLDFFEEHAITPLTFRDLKAIVEGRQTPPKRAVILSFDDGHLDHYTNAFPVLRKHHAKAVFFVIAGKPDQDPRFATRDQIRELASAGFEIGSHSVSHSNLASLGSKRLREEVFESKARIEKEIGLPVLSFCYPAGRYDARVLKLVKESYLFARTTQPWTFLQMKRRYQLPTVRVSPTLQPEQLKRYRNLD